MNSEKFSLKWNDFQQTVSNSFGILKKEQNFFDVTLVSDDEVHLSSHKLVLSACSEFFKSILKKTSNPHPLIYLSGISSRNLNFIMDYIYHGEVEIYQEQLDDFLEVAQKLKIAGLNSDQKQEAEVSKENFVTTDHATFTKEQEFNHQNPKSENKFAEQSYKHPNLSNTAIEKVSFPAMDMDTAELDEKIKEMIDVVNGVFTCKLCGKTAKQKIVVKNHAETHFEGLSFPCQQCGKTFRSKNSFKVHQFKYHKI